MKLKIFGESHAPEIGVEIEGVPAGTRIDMDELLAFMARRAPGNGQGGLSTPRKEPDLPIFETGVKDSIATGETIRAIIRNTNIRPQDYGNVQTVPRPGHADYSSWIKYGNIPTGGGKWSGRLTAPLCIAGGIALQILKRRGVTISAKVVECGGLPCENGSNPHTDLDPADSVGGVVEVIAEGVPQGLGDVGTDGLESKFAAAFFGIPAVKGVEFGAGFRLSAMKGSESNDAFIIEDGKVRLRTNNCGGILGGISIGMPITARVAFKPTPTIAKEQDSVDLRTMTPTKLTVQGRHDRCVAFRAVPVVEAAAAVVLVTEMLAADKEIR